MDSQTATDTPTTPDDEAALCPVAMLRPGGELRFGTYGDSPFIVETGAESVSTWAHMFDNGEVGNVIVFVDDAPSYAHDERRLIGRVEGVDDALWISTAGGDEIGMGGLPGPCVLDVEELTVGSRVVGWVLSPTLVD